MVHRVSKLNRSFKKQKAPYLTSKAPFAFWAPVFRFRQFANSGFDVDEMSMRKK
jgi:hypothetical protein